MSRRTSLAVALLAVLLAPGWAASQSVTTYTTPRGHSPWLGFGVGGGGYSGVFGLAGHLDVGLGFGRLYTAVRFAGVTESIGCCEQSSDRTDVAALVGLQRLSSGSVFALAAGPAHARGQNLDGKPWGLGLEARAVSWGRHGIGLQLYGFANLNSDDSFFGLTLGVRFGGR